MLIRPKKLETMPYNDKNNSTVNRRIYVPLISILSTVLFAPSISHAQENVIERLIPAISLILDEQAPEVDEQGPIDCPVVTTETTLTAGGFAINNQSDVDQFIGITRVEGVLDFGFGPESTGIDLSPFDSLVEATGNFNMRQSGPVNLIGFNCLRSVGGNFNIDSPSAVERIAGFNSLESIGNQFSISGSSNLVSVDGFESLETVGTFFQIIRSDNLTSIPSFNSLTSISQRFVIESNASLTSVAGFESLETIGTFFQIAQNNNLINVSGFESLVSTNSFFQINNNPNLETISGFNSFVSGGNFVGFDRNIVECNSSNQASLLCQ